MLGLAIGTKWNGLYILAAFCVLAVLWDVGTRKAAGAGRPYAAVIRRDLGMAFLATVPVAIATYILSWLGWILSATDGTGGYYRNWATADGRSSSWSWLFPDWWLSLWHYEHEVYKFNINLSSPHTYQSNPWSWLVTGRPVSFVTSPPPPARTAAPSTRARGAPVRSSPSARRCCGGWPASRSCTLPVALVLPPRLARGRDRLRHRGRLPALVPLPGPHDLLLLHDRLRPVPLSGRRHAPGRDRRPPGLLRHPPRIAGATGAGSWSC
ncbi:hypothetical protein SALBM311S_00872 [Streptomyces alboniger]